MRYILPYSITGSVPGEGRVAIFPAYEGVTDYRGVTA